MQINKSDVKSTNTIFTYLYFIAIRHLSIKYRISTANTQGLINTRGRSGMFKLDSRTEALLYRTFPITATMRKDAYQGKIDPRVHASTKRFNQKTNKKTGLDIAGRHGSSLIYASLCSIIWRMYLTSLFHSIYPIFPQYSIICANKLRISKTHLRMHFHSSPRLSSG